MCVVKILQRINDPALFLLLAAAAVRNGGCPFSPLTIPPVLGPAAKDLTVCAGNWPVSA
jgi:hypothetical protein